MFYKSILLWHKNKATHKQEIKKDDVARALGYSNANDAVTRHCRAIVKHDTPISEIRTKHKTTKQEGKQNEDGKKRYQRTHGTR